MNVTVIYFVPESGQILSSGSVQNHLLEANAPSGTDVLVGVGEASPATQYIVNGELVERPTMPLSELPTIIGVGESFTVTGVPAGTECHYIDGVVVIDDGVLEWASDVPGVFSFRLLNFPYQEVFFRAQVTYL